MYSSVLYLLYINKRTRNDVRSTIPYTKIESYVNILLKFLGILIKSANVNL